MAMSDDHKQALAEGRASARAVKAYLSAMEANAPKRGRKRTPESVQARLDTVNADLATAGSIQRLNLIQERMDLEAELVKLTSANEIDLTALEAEFAAHAGHYASSKGISYAAWREMGVPPKLLARAGITRSR